MIIHSKRVCSSACFMASWQAHISALLLRHYFSVWTWPVRIPPVDGVYLAHPVSPHLFSECRDTNTPSHNQIKTMQHTRRRRSLLPAVTGEASTKRENVKTRIWLVLPLLLGFRACSPVQPRLRGRNTHCRSAPQGARGVVRAPRGADPQWHNTPKKQQKRR
jgi:hypothetical protein